MPIPPDRRKAESAPPAPADEWSSQRSLLTCTLGLAVPLWIAELRGRGWEQIQERVKRCADVIAEHGDDLLFRSKKKGGSAEAFNRLAEGIACLSFCPGGVKVFGSHWESCLDDDVPGRSKDALSKLCQAIAKALGES